MEVIVPVTLEEAYTGDGKDHLGSPRRLSAHAHGHHTPRCGGGSRLRIKGEGTGRSNGQGDLYVVVEVLPHGTFQRQGTDLLVEVPSDCRRRCSATEIRVPTMDGRVMMRIPPGTQSGSTFRLQGKGHAASARQGGR